MFLKTCIPRKYSELSENKIANILRVKGGSIIDNNNVGENIEAVNKTNCENLDNAPAPAPTAPSTGNDVNRIEIDLLPVKYHIKNNKRIDIFNVLLQDIFRKFKVKILVLYQFIHYCLVNIKIFFKYLYKKIVLHLDNIVNTYIKFYIISIKNYKYKKLFYSFKEFLFLIFRDILKNIKKYSFIIIIFFILSAFPLGIVILLKMQKIQMQKYMDQYLGTKPTEVLIRATEDIQYVVRTLTDDFSYKSSKNLINSTNDEDFSDLLGTEKDSLVKRGKNLRIIRIANYLIDQIEQNLKNIDQFALNLSLQNREVSKGYYKYNLILQLIHSFTINLITHMKKYLGIYFKAYKILDTQLSTPVLVAALRESLISVKEISIDAKIKYISNLIMYGRMVHVYAARMATLSNIMTLRAVSYREYTKLASKIINFDNASALKLLICKVITTLSLPYLKFMQYQMEYHQAIKELDILKTLPISKEDFYVRNGVLKFLKKALATGDSSPLSKLLEVSVVEIPTPKI